MAAGTETLAARYRGLDIWSDEEILDAFWEGQARAIGAIRPALPAIAAAAEALAQRLKTGGRIVYAGAGASGLLAAGDAMEIGPTFVSIRSMLSRRDARRLCCTPSTITEKAASITFRWG